MILETIFFYEASFFSDFFIRSHNLNLEEKNTFILTLLCYLLVDWENSQSPREIYQIIDYFYKLNNTQTLNIVQNMNDQKLWRKIVSRKMYAVKT